ncbi:uncharacterized protein [Asterias amurensis]|uniref:uncharacterized protein n=1 Tax=Asterias amurensis TaxID=7602 RepID=UPI003AB43A1D
MAVTSKVSATTSFPLRILNAGPSFIREAPTKDHHKLGHKSAMERLAESRAKFVRTGSGEELDDAKGNENRTKPTELKTSRVTASQESHVFKAVPYYVCGDAGDRGPQLPKKTCPRPPVPDDSDVRKPEVTTLRKGRDRTLEIVAASLALSEKNNSSSDDDVLNPSPNHLLVSSASASPQSPREALSAGSRVRKLKEQFQVIGSAESESDTSQGRKTPTEKSGSSPKSFHSWKGGRETDHTTSRNSRKPQLSLKSTEPVKDSQEEVAHPPARRSSSSEDKSHPSERQVAAEPKTNHQTELTRRQIERFKAQHAMKESCQERKINKIVLKPRSRVSERSEQSLAAIEPFCKMSSITVNERAPTSTDETDYCHPVLHLGKHSLGSNANPRHKHSQEIVAGNCKNQETLHANNHEVTEAMKSDELARLMQSMEQKSTEPSTDTKPSGARHPIQHVRERVSKMRLESDDPKESSSMDVNHRRAKSDLDRSNLARSSSETKPNRVRHLSHDDQLRPEQDIPHQQQKRKVSAPSVSHQRVKSSPDTLENFQKKSWAPINFNQNQEWVTKSDRITGRELRASSTVVQTPRTHAPNKNLPRQLFSQEPGMHEQAKTTVKSFLSGVMSSPMHLQNANDKNSKTDNEPVVIEDGNGNQIGTETSQGFRGTFSPTRPTTTGSKDLNLNLNNLAENKRNTVEVSSQVASSRDVELTLMTSQEHPYEQIKFVAQEPVSNVNENRGVRYPDKTKLRHVDLVEKPRHEECGRSSKFGQKADVPPFKHSRNVEPRHGDNETSTKAAEPRAKKISLADLLSKDNSQEVAEVSQTKGTEVRRGATEYKRHRLPSRSDRSHGDNSETDSDEELQRSKVLRVRKTRADSKKQDKSLQNLLSRIINPEDDLNTLKRGQKISDLKKSEQEATQQSKRDDSTADMSHSKPLLVNVAGSSVPCRYQATNLARPLLNLNIATKSKRKDAFVSPPASLTSPTRRDMLRRRSKSDLGMSPRCSISSAHSEVDYFFNQMGMNDSFFQGPLSPLHYSDEDDVFHNMHEYKHDRAGSFSTEDSDNISRGSNVSNEGLHLAKKLPDTSSSIITKNARVIKWLCQIRKARASSIS